VNWKIDMPHRFLSAAILLFVWAMHSLAADWVIVRRDGATIHCRGPFLIVNGTYHCDQERGSSGTIPAEQVDAAKTQLANSSAIARSTAAPASRAESHAASECSNAVHQAFEAQNIHATVAAFTRGAQIGFESQLGKETNPAQRRLVVQAVRGAFSADAITARLKQTFVDYCRLEMLGGVISGMGSPLGQKMSRLEVFASSPEGSRQMADYARSLALHPPGRDRLLLVQRLETSTGSIDLGIDTLAAVIRGMGSGLGMQNDLNDTARTRFSAALGQGDRAYLLFTYRNATDSELAQYVDLNETHAFHEFHEEFKKAFLEVIEEQSQELGVRLRRVMTPKGSGA
jgi:hypothetical protein